MCTKAHFQSLHDTKLVESSVIDAWTCMLNENEILRSDSSPLRLFLNTETTVRFDLYQICSLIFYLIGQYNVPYM